MRVDQNGQVSNVGFFSRKATITAVITDTGGNIFKDKITIVFYKNNSQLSRHVSNAYSEKYQVFTEEQITEILHIVKTVALNYFKAQLV
ncbi:hypothetical protein SDC9_200019 [bioreactor metagenome]|uniref:Uncharacterized protein n=1 Tax=bioreactor metagenome TaxID=1076179 RepID=A0A645IM36_9ZZZZ